MDELLMLAAFVGATALLLERLHRLIIAIKSIIAEFKRKKDPRDARKRR